jgi:hypothetical protein
MHMRWSDAPRGGAPTRPPRVLRQHVACTQHAFCSRAATAARKSHQRSRGAPSSVDAKEFTH